MITNYEVIAKIKVNNVIAFYRIKNVKTNKISDVFRDYALCLINSYESNAKVVGRSYLKLKKQILKKVF